MSSFPFFVSQGLRIAAACVIGLWLFRTVRWIHEQSQVAGVIVAAGIMLRATIGLSLFWISFLNLPLLRSSHWGDGFWALMGDARGYYRYAVTAIEVGLDTITPGFSSPLFTKTLALWMHVVGVSPAAGLMLNVCLYTALAALVTRMFKPHNQWRDDLPYIVGVGAFFLSPVLVIHGTQTLKEDLFNTLIGLLCISTLYALRPIVYGIRHSRATFAASLMMVNAITFYLAGIRAYYAAIAWGVMVCVLSWFLLRQRLRRVPRYSIAAVLLLTAMWASYAYGAGPYYRGPTFADADRLARGSEGKERNPAQALYLTLVNMVEHARRGFWLTGGATNVSITARRRGPGRSGYPAPSSAAATEEDLSTESGATRSATDRLITLIVGLGVVFVPVSILKALGIVEFSGGRGLLPFADADTMFLDITLVAIAALLWTRRRAIGDRLPFVAFTVTLSLVTASLLGYVVTNFGTLFRMRAIVAVPMWMLGLALSNAPQSDVVDRFSPRR